MWYLQSRLVAESLNQQRELSVLAWVERDLLRGSNEQLNLYIQALPYRPLPRRSISNYILYLYTDSHVLISKLWTWGIETPIDLVNHKTPASKCSNRLPRHTVLLDQIVLGSLEALRLLEELLVESLEENTREDSTDSLHETILLADPNVLDELSVAA